MVDAVGLVEIGGVDVCERLKKSKLAWEESWTEFGRREGTQWVEETASWEELVRLKAYCEENETWSDWGVAAAIGGPDDEWGWDEAFGDDCVAEALRCEGSVKGFCEGALKVFGEVAGKIGAAV